MFILSNVAKLYDGTGATRAALHERMDVVVDGGRITEVRPHAAAPAGVMVVDCSGFTVTPGLVDCHGHITILGLSDARMELNNSGSALIYVEKVLYASLVNGGVTTMRDIGGATHRMKRLVDEGAIIGPRLKVAICMLSTTGGHADFRGPDRCHAALSRLFPPEAGRPSSIVDGPWECRKRVREIAACGADLIKICASPGVASPTDHLEDREFTAEEIGAICDEARGRGLRVAAHAHSQSGIELAIENGVADIQHISFMDQRLVEMAHAKGCTVTPTSWIVQTIPSIKGLNPYVIEKAKRVSEVHSSAVQYARSGGLKILAGSDPVLPAMHGQNYLELVALMRDGLGALEAWHAATGLAAPEIGQSDTGTIQAGKRADILVFREDVVDRPDRFSQESLLEVIKDGVAYRGGCAGLPRRTYGDTATEFLRLPE